MNNLKRWITVSILVLLIVTIISIILKNYIKKNETIYEPEEEISEDAERKTLVNLYYKNKVNNKVEPVVELIDVKELVNNPYSTLFGLLTKEPKNQNFERIIPEKTIVNKAKMQGDMLILDLSEEFIANTEGEENERNIVESITRTMTQLTEVNAIKFLINGEENKGFIDGKINFEREFEIKE